LKAESRTSIYCIYFTFSELGKLIESEVQDKIEKKETSEISSGAEGMHEAIQDIVKAMQDLKNYLF
jgi:hypothetical protein